MFPCAPMTRPPLPSMVRTAASSRSAFQSAATTRAPSAANRVAMANPMPDAAPVITTTLPASRIESPVWSDGLDQRDAFGGQVECDRAVRAELQPLGRERAVGAARRERRALGGQAAVA